MEYMKDVENCLKGLKERAVEYANNPLTSPDLIDENSKRLEALNALSECKEIETESASYYDRSDLDEMWKKVYLLEMERSDVERDVDWVLRFVDDVVNAQRSPHYLHTNKTTKSELCRDLYKYTEKLKHIYKINCYDDKVIANDDGIMSGSISPIDKNMKPPKLSIIEVLDSFCDSLMFDISVQAQGRNEKEDENVRARVFIRAMAHRNGLVYGEFFYPLLSVLVWFLYQKYYDNQTISKVMFREGKIQVVDYV